MSKEHRKYPFDLCDFIFRRLRLRGSTHVDSRSRKRQEKSWISFATIILVSAFAIADPNPLNSKSSIDDVLDALQARGKNLTSFTAAVTSTDTDANGAETTRTGKLAYQAKPGGNWPSRGTRSICSGWARVCARCPSGRIRMMCIRSLTLCWLHRRPMIHRTRFI